jgi:hypothetical protein
MKMDQNGIDYWQTAIEKHEKSGLTRAEFCRRNGLKDHLFNYWAKKLKKSGAPKIECEDNSPTLNFVRVIENKDEQPSSNGRERVLRIQTSYGCTIEVPL